MLNRNVDFGNKDEQRPKQFVHYAMLIHGSDRKIYDFHAKKNKIDNFSGTRFFSHQNRYTNVNFIAVHHKANS